MQYYKNNKTSIVSRSNQTAIILWVFFFCYSVCAALIFQKVLLELFSGFGAAGGLLPSDSKYFHNVAMDLAEQIRLQGWSAWKIYPTENTSINTAILALLYRLFGFDPTTMIPINAAFHALGGVLIYKICCEVANKKHLGMLAGIVAATMFVIFPSALNWYAQVHKDGYLIVGSLLVLLSWLKAINFKRANVSFLILLLLNFLGVVIIGCVRHYNLTLILVATVGACLILTIFYVYSRQLYTNRKVLIFFILSLFFITGTINFISNLRDAQFNSGNITSNVLGESFYQGWHSEEEWEWRTSSWLPNRVESSISTVARVRARLIEYGQSINAKSLIDDHIKPQNISEVILFLPRALQIGAFAPFPRDWFSNLEITKLVASFEMTIYYTAAFGVLLLLFINRSPAVFISIYFASFFLLVYGFTLANLGSLYRIRYPYIFIILSLGVLGWITWFDKKSFLKKIIDFFRGEEKLVNQSSTADFKPSRKAALKNSLFVIVLTFLCFFGFFIRDILMAREFGLAQSLDNFYIALIIPMFIVTVLLIPAGNAFIPLYLDFKQRVTFTGCFDLIRSFALWISIVSLIICLILFSFGPSILSKLISIKSDVDIVELNTLYHLALVLLLFGGLVILGNSVLNAESRALLSTGAQLIVPVTSIVALLLFGQQFGVYSVMYGMLLGQVLNLVIVHFSLKYHLLSLIPSFNKLDKNEASIFVKLYIPQMVSVLFTGLALPLASILAVSLPSGAVSVFNLGSKVVIFITGIITAVMSVIILPYFSNLVVKNHIVELRRELSFFLLLSTFISVPISFLMYVYAESIAQILFTGGRFDSNSTAQVVRVMQYSIVQLPFFVCNALLLKFALASKHLVSILVVSIWGLLVTLGSSLLLTDYMGVAGIAFAVSISTFSSTVILTLFFVRYRHIVYFDALILFLSWLLFITLLMCTHFQSSPSAYSTTLAYVVLIAVYLYSLQNSKALERGRS